ncbi:MAG: hypothetical protein R3Y56_02415, partial [Akkermansia sp.]
PSRWRMAAPATISSRHQMEELQHCQATPSRWRMVAPATPSARHQVQGISTAKPRLQGGAWWNVPRHRTTFKTWLQASS